MAGVRSEFRLVAGLGNVGARYAGTRHNAGLWYADGVVERLHGAFREDRKAHGALARVTAGGRDIRVLKPSTLMNRSGLAVAALVNFHKIPPASVLVAHDDLDLPPGTVRIKHGGGHGGHNGLRDIARQLGTPDFWRLRIGVGHPGDREGVIDYVLTKPSPADREAIDAAIERALDQTDRLIGEGDIEGAMHALHTRA